MFFSEKVLKVTMKKVLNKILDFQGLGKPATGIKIWSIWLLTEIQNFNVNCKTRNFCLYLIQFIRYRTFFNLVQLAQT